MSFFNYVYGIPVTANDPSVDQPNMTINNNSAFNIWDIDHFGFNDNQGGYHNIIHMPSNSTPALIAGIGQVFAQTVGSDIQLFYESALGVVSQLTGPSAPSANTNGYIYLSGGILLQWGTIPIAKTGTATPVLFATSNINFPNNCYVVLPVFINDQGNSPSANTVFVKSGTVSKLGFTLTNSSSSSTQSAFWAAIGN